MNAAFLTDEARWLAFLARDPAADGQFLVAVNTTGIFCRPVCPARPKRVNICFIESREACLAAGFRPCKRCRP
jgi:AraC family transcriptional regulator, regulatory protein of adaptative response / methylated-DNA-[protein]-cysteine methyltransferase